MDLDSDPTPRFLLLESPVLDGRTTTPLRCPSVEKRDGPPVKLFVVTDPYPPGVSRLSRDVTSGGRSRDLGEYTCLLGHPGEDRDWWSLGPDGEGSGCNDWSKGERGPVGPHPGLGVRSDQRWVVGPGVTDSSPAKESGRTMCSVAAWDPWSVTALDTKTLCRLV